MAAPTAEIEAITDPLENKLNTLVENRRPPTRKEWDAFVAEFRTAKAALEALDLVEAGG